MIDLSRDPTARPEHVRQLIRRGRLDLLADEELRAHAWRLIEAGAAPRVEAAGVVRPLIHDSDPDTLARDTAERRVLVAPIRVSLLWDDTRARLFACDCAARVLPIFESAHPGDDRPRRAIEVARLFVSGQATREEMDAASDAARAAAWDAASDAARAAARDAALAARAAALAARAAASDAAGDAERAWQHHRLLAYLLGGQSDA